MTEKMIKVGYVYGWRVLCFDENMQLYSPVKRAPWHGEPMPQAKCHPGVRRMVPAPGKDGKIRLVTDESNYSHPRYPDEHCNCGYYSYWNPTGLATYDQYRRDQDCVHIIRDVTENPVLAAPIFEDIPEVLDLYIQVQENPRNWLWNARANSASLVVVTKNWGRIIPHVYGFRSEYTQLAAICPDVRSELEMTATWAVLNSNKDLHLIPLSEVIEGRYDDVFTDTTVEMPESEVL